MRVGSRRTRGLDWGLGIRSPEGRVTVSVVTPPGRRNVFTVTFPLSRNLQDSGVERSGRAPSSP